MVASAGPLPESRIGSPNREWRRMVRRQGTVRRQDTVDKSVEVIERVSRAHGERGERRRGTKIRRARAKIGRVGAGGAKHGEKMLAGGVS